MGHGYVHLMTWIVLVRSSSANPSQSMHGSMKLHSGTVRDQGLQLRVLEGSCAPMTHFGSHNTTL